MNRLTTIMLDIFEDQSDLGRLTLMDEATAILDRQLAALGRAILRGGGGTSMADAKRRAEKAYDQFNSERKRLRHLEADKTIAALKSETKQLSARRILK